MIRESSQKKHWTILLAQPRLVLVLQLGHIVCRRHSVVLALRVLVVHRQPTESQVPAELRFQRQQRLDSAPALKLKHREDLVVPPRHRVGLVAVTGAQTEEAGHIGILQQFVLQPHLSGLRQRPNLSRISVSGNGSGIFAGSQDTQPVLSVHLNPALSFKKSS